MVGMRKIGVLFTAAVLALAMLPVGTAKAVTGAGFTTFNEAVDGPDHCKNSVINCNIYDGKEFVWTNGGPTANQLGADGQYFFVVLAPGGQPDPNDGGAKNLSDDFDSYTNRTFTVTNGEVSAYGGTHDFDSGTGSYPRAVDTQPPFIRLFPYADTTNPGGVYIMGMCSLASGYPVTARDCKFDAFKVQEAEIPTRVQAVLSGTKYRDDNKDGQLGAGEVGLAGWEISISDGTTTVTATTDSAGEWTFTTPARTVGEPTRVYTITEVLKPNWKQTGNTTNQYSTTGSVSVVLSAMSYTVTVPNDVPGSASGLNFGNIPQGTVSGLKYNDKDKSGTFNTGDVGLATWSITQAGAASATLVTDGTGAFTTTLDPGIYTFTEVLQTGWRQTGNTSSQTAVTGGALAGLASFVYTVTIPNDQPSTVSGLNFGNIPQGTVTGMKYYDANTSGQNESEAGISGWRISQGGAAIATLTTGAGGTFTTTLDPGTYSFTEIVAAAPWTQTGNTFNQSSTSGGATTSLAAKSYTVVIPNDQPSTVSGLYFGNVCVGAGGGLTMGFWSNKNGQALITAGDLTMLTGLNLRNANGSNFDPATKDLYRTWLLNANATNMAYMLSAQLSAMELNVAHGFVSGGSLIYAPGTTSANGAGFATVNAVMAEANTELGLHPDTTSGSSGDAFRSYQEALKNALDRANNNLNFVQSGPGGCPTPVFPA